MKHYTSCFLAMKPTAARATNKLTTPITGLILITSSGPAIRTAPIPQTRPWPPRTGLGDHASGTAHRPVGPVHQVRGAMDEPIPRRAKGTGPSVSYWVKRFTLYVSSPDTGRSWFLPQRLACDFLLTTGSCDTESPKFFHRCRRRLVGFQFAVHQCQRTYRSRCLRS
jgi:hypothetical protein